MYTRSIVKLDILLM